MSKEALRPFSFSPLEIQMYYRLSVAVYIKLLVNGFFLSHVMFNLEKKRKVNMFTIVCKITLKVITFYL